MQIVKRDGTEVKFDISKIVEAISKLIEEMAELTQAINKHRRYNTNSTKCNLIEEIADVSIVLSQIVYLLKIDENMFKKYIANKIKRTNKRYNNCGKFIERNDLNE